MGSVNRQCVTLWENHWVAEDFGLVGFALAREFELETWSGPMHR